MYRCWKNQEKLPKMTIFPKITIFGDFSWFFQQRYIGKSWGFLRCNQCVLALHLSYQTPQSDEFHFLASNAFLQIFRPLVRGGGTAQWRSGLTDDFRLHDVGDAVNSSGGVQESDGVSIVLPLYLHDGVQVDDLLTVRAAPRPASHRARCGGHRVVPLGDWIFFKTHLSQNPILIRFLG